MDEKKQVYNIILTIWNLFKKYGFHKLSDAKWEEMIDECGELAKRLRNNKNINRLFLDMFSALQNYYINKSREEKEIKGQETLPLQEKTDEY